MQRKEIGRADQRFKDLRTRVVKAANNKELQAQLTVGQPDVYFKVYQSQNGISLLARRLRKINDWPSSLETV